MAPLVHQYINIYQYITIYFKEYLEVAGYL